MEKIPAEVAQIEWEDDDNGRITELVVFNRDTITERTRAKYEKKFSASHGACVDGWLTPESPSYTPEGQFAERVLDGFADEDTYLRALDQFSQIEGAMWARVMAESVRRELRARFSEDDEAREQRYPDPWSDV